VPTFATGRKTLKRGREKEEQYGKTKKKEERLRENFSQKVKTNAKGQKDSTMSACVSIPGGGKNWGGGYGFRTDIFTAALLKS
jgi:hypothetical protein